MSHRIKYKRCDFTLNSINSLFLAIFSVFYLHHYSTVSIVFITCPIIVELILVSIKSDIARARYSIIFTILLLEFVFLTQYIFLKNAECMSFMFSMTYYIACVISFDNLNLEKIKKRCKQILLFGIFLLTIDCVWRIQHPLVSDFYQGAYSFYKYKGPGILFIDTNNTGMMVLCLIGLCWYLEIEWKQNLLYYKTILVMLLVLTFSRACILAYFVFFFVFNKKINVWVRRVVIIVLGSILIANLAILSEDVSTSLKITMLVKVLDYIRTADFVELLLGIGFTNSIYRFGLFTHSWPLTFTVELGIVGFAILIAVWIAILRESHAKNIYILAPFLLAGLSFFPLLSPYLYNIMAIIICMENKRIK